MDNELEDYEEEEVTPAEQRKREGTTADLRDRLRRLEQEFDVLHGHIDAQQLELLVRYLEWLIQDPTLDEQSADGQALYEDLSAADELRVHWRQLEAARDQCLSDIGLAEQKEFSRDIDTSLDVYKKKIADTADRLFGFKLDCVVSKITHEKSNDTYIDWKNERPSWRIGNLDSNFPKNHLQSIDGMQALLSALGNYETMTWGEIEQAPHCHSWVSTENWTPEANSRLQDLNLNSKKGWWQLRGNSMQRIFGYREGPIMNIVWDDLLHDIYRTRSRKK